MNNNPFSALNAGSLSPVDRDVTKGRAIPADEKRTGLYICIYVYIYRDETVRKI